MIRSYWARHPHVRSGADLTRGERAADAMRNGMGSWPFIFGALTFLAAWMLSDGAGTDLKPWIVLNLILSCLAGLMIPGVGRLPNQSVVAALALLMFISCYRLNDGGFRSVRGNGSVPQGHRPQTGPDPRAQIHFGLRALWDRQDETVSRGGLEVLSGAGHSEIGENEGGP